MNVIVCLKQVPGITDVKIDPQTNTLIRQGIKNVINPFDTYALEEGVRLKERCSGKVTVISMGPPQALEMLREALSLGADEAILLCDKAFAGADTWATAYTLSRAVHRSGQYSVIICGRQTIDGDTGQVGPELSEMLGIPFIGNVNQIEEINNQEMRVRRMTDEGQEVIHSPLPALITVTREINIPRLPSLRGLAKSKTAAIPTWSAQDLSVDLNKVGLSGSHTRVVRIFSPKREKQAQILQGEPEIQVDCLVGKLKYSGLI